MSNLSNENKKLLSLIKKNDSKAYAKIYSKYYNDLCKYLLNYTSNRQVAEDIVQEVLLKLWVKRNQIEIYTSLNSYLFRASYYGFLDYYKSKKSVNESLESLRFNLLNEIITEEVEITEQKTHDLRTAIDKLPKKCKQIFLLNKYEGYRYKEIATYLDISVKTVENQIGIAYKTLRKSLLFLVFYLLN